MSQGCTKTPYPGKTSARRAAKRVSDSSGNQFRAYYCQECRKWHITHQIPFEQLPIQARNKKKGKSRGRRPAPGQSIEDLAAQMRGDNEE